MERDHLPHSLEVLWGRAERRRRPTQALSLERIVSAAIELADAEGLPALSMARLAEQLGCATMSLYRHVASKDELQVFMMDAAPGEPPIAEDPGEDWRRGLQRWATALRAVYYRHPWILQITAGRPPLEPGQLAWLDAALRVLADIKLRPDEKLAVVMLVLNYVRGEAQIGTALRTNGDADDAWYWRTLAELVTPERFPALAELIAADTAGITDPIPGGGSTDSSDPLDGGGHAGTVDTFDFGLARVLDGIDAFLIR